MLQLGGILAPPRSARRMVKLRPNRRGLPEVMPIRSVILGFLESFTPELR